MHNDGMKSLAGILTLLTIATLALAACGGATTEALPTEAPSTGTPTAVAPAQQPTGVATPGVTLSIFPPVTCCRGLAIAAARYEIPRWLGIPLSVQIGEGWRVLNEPPALLFLIGKGQNVQDNPSQMIAFLNVTGKTTPEASIASVQRAPELTATAGPVPVTIAGFPGLQLDSTARPNPSFEGSAGSDIPPGVQYLPVLDDYFSPGFTWTTSTPEARVRTIVLTVNDQTLLLYLEAPPDEFESFIAGADAILQSLELIQ